MDGSDDDKGRNEDASDSEESGDDSSHEDVDDILVRVPKDKQTKIDLDDEPKEAILTVNKKKLRKIKVEGHFGGKNVQ